MSNNFANRALLASGAFAAALAVQNALPAAAAELPRDHITLPETISVDITNGTVTLPLYRGTAHGRAAYYIITEASSAAEATRLRVSFAPSISGTHTQNATGSAGSLAFNGAPDFSPARVYTPSASGFPPAGAAPGAVGDAAYSPFVKLADGTTLDAPIVATGDAADTTTHTDTGDRVLAISADKKTVTILLAQGFFNGSRVVYLSTEASEPQSNVRRTSSPSTRRQHHRKRRLSHLPTVKPAPRTPRHRGSPISHSTATSRTMPRLQTRPQTVRRSTCSRHSTPGHRPRRTPRYGRQVSASGRPPRSRHIGTCSSKASATSLPRRGRAT